MKSKLFTVLAFLSLAVSGATAASVTLTGGSPSGTIQLEILNDITLVPKPGESFSGFMFNMAINGAISSASTYWSGQTAFDIPSTANPPLTYQTTASAPILSMSNISMTAHTQGNNSLVLGIMDSGFDQPVIEEGGNVTFKAGIYTYDLVTNLGGEYTLILQNPGMTYNLTIDNFSSYYEGLGGETLSATNAMFVPEPSTSVIALMGALGCALRRRR